MFALLGFLIAMTLRHYRGLVVSDCVDLLRKEIMRPFEVCTEDVDEVVNKGHEILIEGPGGDTFYMMGDITDTNSVVESITTGDRFSYQGNIRNDFRSLIEDGFHLYLREAYDKVLSCGIELDIEG